MKVLLLATRRMGLDGLKAIAAAGHQVVGVVTRDYEITEGCGVREFREAAEELGVPCLVTDKINNEEFVGTISQWSPDIGVSLYWRRLIKEPVASVPKHGFINTHASDLPMYRGFAAASWAILQGEKRMGVSVHRVEPGVADTGEIYLKRFIDIGPNTTIAGVFEKLNPLVIEMNLEVLKGIEEGKMRPKKQEGKAVDAYPRLPSDGEMDWKESAVKLHRLVCAVTRPYPGAFTYFSGKKLFIWKTGVVEDHPAFAGMPGHVVRYTPEGYAWVLTGDGILLVEEVQFEGNPPAKPAQIMKGMQNRLGMKVCEEILALKKELAELRRMLNDSSTRTQQ